MGADDDGRPVATRNGPTVDGKGDLVSRVDLWHCKNDNTEDNREKEEMGVAGGVAGAGDIEHNP